MRAPLSGIARIVFAAIGGLLTVTGLLTLSTGSSSAQTTYTWNVTGSGSWTSSSNWTPTRSLTTPTDILVVDGSLTPTPTLTGIPNQTIGRLLLVNNAQPTLSVTAASARTLTINGGTGTDLDIPYGSGLHLASTPDLTIQLSSTATGLVAGQIEIVSGGHRVVATGTESLVFAAGSTMTMQSGSTGNVFGTTGVNTVEFQAGSEYVSSGGSDPFGAATPQSVVMFQAGSLYTHQQTAAPSLSGRTYANFRLNSPGYNVLSMGSLAFTVDDLTITAGQFRLELADIHIRGNVAVAEGSGGLTFTPPASTQTVHFEGFTPQSVGAVTFNAADISIENPAGVSLMNNVQFYGNTKVNTGCKLIVRSGLGNHGIVSISGTLQLEATGSPAGGIFNYGPGSTLVFNTTLNYLYIGASYWNSPSPPPNVTIQGGANVILGAATPPITGVLTLSNGNFKPQSCCPLIMGPGGSVLGGSPASYVNGPFQKYIAASGTPTTATFEVGDDSSYLPATLDFPSVTSGGYFLVSTTMGDHPNIMASGLDPSRSANRFWTVSNVSAAVPSGSATFLFDSSDVDSGADPLAFDARSFQSPTWTTQTVGNRTLSSTRVTGVTTFGDFAIGNRAWLIEPSTGPNGSITPGTTVSVLNGQNQLFDITPDPCYVVQNVLVDGDSIGPVTEYTFVNVTGDHTISATFTAVPPAFVDISAGLPGVMNSATAWGDFDNDGDLDLFLGGDTGSSFISRIYRDDSGTLADIGAGLVPLAFGSASWGDFDNDGDPDLLVTGSDGFARVSTIYRNNAGVFVDVGAALPGVTHSAAAWGDYDNDGDLDLVLTGETNAGQLSKLFRNAAGVFTDSGVALTNVDHGSVAWGDYDRDGDLDLVMAGNTGASSIANVYRNDSGTFADIGAGLTGTSGGSVAWGDIDSDGDLDLAIQGLSNAGRVTLVYRNDGGTFVDTVAGLPGFDSSGLAWGDADNDGDLDLVASGATDTGPLSRIFRNEGSGFTVLDVGFTGVSNGSAAWGDVDEDGTLDVVLTGNTGSQLTTAIFTNGGCGPNAPPAAPGGLSAHLACNMCTFSWTASTDDHTPVAGLTYNLRIGTTPGGSEISSAMANSGSGLRFVPAAGNANHRLSWTIALPLASQYFWSVQAVDASFAGSTFAPEERAACFEAFPPPFPPLEAGFAVWGDYDQDGYLDALVGGSSESSRIFHNLAGQFSEIPTDLVGVIDASGEWGDFDNDGDLDLVISGARFYEGGESVTNIYRNDSGTFVDINAGLPGLSEGSLTWGDFDEDGDLDLFLLGEPDQSGGPADPIDRLYMNEDGQFSDSGMEFPPMVEQNLDVGDYDEDGDLDILVSVGTILRNDNGAFTLAPCFEPSLVQQDELAYLIHAGSVEWGDYDNDGDLDILITGQAIPPLVTGLIAKVLRNDNGTYVVTQSSLTPVVESVGRWGDFDSDGDLDILLGGRLSLSSTAASLMVYCNDGGTFLKIWEISPGAYFYDENHPASWGDFDNDGDLDILSTVGIFKNVMSPPNSRPSAPTDLSAELEPNGVTFSWSQSTDAETPAEGLTYNLRIGTTIGGSEIKSGMADFITGIRSVPQHGNVGQRLSWTLKHQSFSVLLNPIYWSVQAIDPGFLASAQISGGPVSAVDGAPPRRKLVLETPSPNPFRGTTALTFEVAKPMRMLLRVFDVSGRLVRSLADGTYESGRHTISWNGADDRGRMLTAGIYVVRLEGGGEQSARRIVLLTQ